MVVITESEKKDWQGYSPVVIQASKERLKDYQLIKERYKERYKRMDIIGRQSRTSDKEENNGGIRYNSQVYLSK